MECKRGRVAEQKPDKILIFYKIDFVVDRIYLKKIAEEVEGPETKQIEKLALWTIRTTKVTKAEQNQHLSSRMKYKKQQNKQELSWSRMAN